MTQALNYCTHAAEKMRVLTDGLIGPRNHNIMTAIVASARETIILMHMAEKFILPDWGRIFSTDERKMLNDLHLSTRLPFPICAMEYPCPYDAPGVVPMMPQEVASSKRIALLVETEAIQEHCECFKTMDDKRGGTPGFYVFPVSYIDTDGVWTPPPAAMFFPRGGNDFLRDEGRPCILPLGAASYGAYPEKDRATRVARDLADECLATVHLLMALSLDHGRHEVLPAPRKLNKSRAKKGKKPLYEYKVLDIVADVLGPKIASRPSMGGHHASPRMHKRRGHVRRLSSGKQTWVRNAIIGKPQRGQVIKEYAVHE